MKKKASVSHLDRKESMHILLTDAYSAQHVGNMALVDNTLDQLKIQFPEAEFTILAFDPVSIGKNSGCKTIATLWAGQFSGYGIVRKMLWLAREGLWIVFTIFNLLALKPLGLFLEFEKYTFSKEKLRALKAYENADIIVSISGEMLQDSEWKRAPFFLFGYWLAHRMGKIVAIFPQSLGPFNKSFLRFIVRRVLKGCDLVLARDELSLKTIERLKIDPARLFLIPDVAVNQPYISKEKARKLLEEEGVRFNGRLLVAVTISRWKKLNYEEYFLTFKKMCRFIIEDLNGIVVFFVASKRYLMDLGDWGLTCRLYEALGDSQNAILLLKTYSPAEFKGMLSQMDLFISTRMHAAILATMAGTPTITVNTQPKLRGYMSLIDQGARSCEIKDFTLDKAKKVIKDTLSENKKIRLNLQRCRNEIVERALSASELLRMVYNEKKRDVS